MEKVTVDKRRRVWERIFNYRFVEKIYSNQSGEEEKLHSCANMYVTCKPDSSWEKLAHVLYNWGGMAAAKEAKALLQQKGRWFIDEQV